jgi:hypothetical protein
MFSLQKAQGTVRAALFSYTLLSTPSYTSGKIVDTARD